MGRASLKCFLQGREFQFITDLRRDRTSAVEFTLPRTDFIENNKRAHRISAGPAHDDKILAFLPPDSRRMGAQRRHNVLVRCQRVARR